MSEEQVGGLPDELETWVDERSAETDRSREEVLARAIATYRLLSTGDRALRENGEAPVDPLDERLADLAQRVDSLDAETTDNIEDLRTRVVQVMQTAQSKADPDHDHEALEERLASLETAEDSLDDRVEELQDRVDGGFENYERILESLNETTEALEEKLDTLAHAVVDLRGRAGELEAANARRDAVEDLQQEANRKGVRTANCGSCRSQVHVGLLSEPQCPHCGGVFDSVEPGGRFLGSAKLTVGTRPALSSGGFEPTEPAALFDDDE